MFNKILFLVLFLFATTAHAAYFNELSFPQNACLMGPVSGGSGPAKARALLGADLPLPGASSLGGVQSHASVTHEFLTQISTSGVVSAAQPAFSDISGSVAAAQLPNPSSSSLGGVQSVAAVTSNWIDSISTAGVPHLSQPAFTDISGSASSAQLPTSAVTPGSYTNASITVDSHGVVTAASSGASSAQNVTSKTSAYSAAVNDVVFADATSGAFSVTLPAASASTNGTIKVIKSDSSANVITLALTGGDTILGSGTSRTLTDQGNSVILISNGSNAWGAF